MTRCITVFHLDICYLIWYMQKLWKITIVNLNISLTVIFLISWFYLNRHFKYTLELQTQLRQACMGVFTKLFLISQSGANAEWGANCYCTTSDIFYVYSLCFAYSCSLNSSPIIQGCEIKISHAAHSTVCLNL